MEKKLHKFFAKVARIPVKCKIKAKTQNEKSMHVINNKIVLSSNSLLKMRSPNQTSQIFIRIRENVIRSYK